MISKEKLKKLTSKIGSGSTPRGGKSTYLEDGPYKLIRSQNIYNHYYTPEGLAYITNEQAEKLKNVSLKKRDILINITGDSVARTTIVENNMLPGRVNQHVSIIRCEENLLDPYYLLAFLTNKNTQKHLLSLAQAGGTRPALTKGMLEQLEVPLLSYEQQKKVGNTLKIINEKISVNNSIILLLEQISQALFKKWFIDFDFPNVDGQPYKTSGGEMIESELGLIPAQWVIVKLSNITTVLKKTFNPRKTDLNKVVHFSLPAYDKNQQPTLDDVLTIKSNKWLIEDNCVIFSKMNPITPRVWLTITNNEFSSVASSEFVVLKSKSKEMNGFIYNICKSEVFNSYLITHATGSTNSRQRVTPTIALQFPIALNDDIVKNYSNTVVGMTETIKVLSKENAHLQQLRNVLLPKLMAGEVETFDEVEE